jgi:hypothetical protein
MKKTTFGLVFLSLTLIFACQENEPDEIDQLFFDQGEGLEKTDYSVYANITETNRQVVFLDGFSDNSGKWYEGKNTIYNNLHDFHIANGFYYMDYNVSGKMSGFTKDAGTTLFSGDFEIETNLEFLKSYSGSSGKFGLFWNDNDLSSNEIYYFYEITPDIKVITAGAITGNTRKEWKSLDKSSSSMLNSPQVKLTLRRVGNYYYFFVNESFVCRTGFQSIDFGKTGVFLTQCAVRVDYFRISNISR